MSTHQQIVQQAGDVLLAHEIGKQEHVRNLWKSVQWLSFGTQALDTEAELDQAKGPQIRLYPSLVRNPKAVKAALREFGLLILAKGGDRAQEIWEKKLIAPKPEEIESFNQKLKDPAVREKCHTYEDLVQQYPNKGHSVERLVAIHFCNALLANNVSYPDSIGIDIQTWGPTAQFATGKKYYSLVPLSSAYAPGDIHRCFGCAFAACLTDNLRTVLDTSVAGALRTIIQNVVQRAATPQ